MGPWPVAFIALAAVLLAAQGLEASALCVPSGCELDPRLKSGCSGPVIVIVGDDQCHGQDTACPAHVRIIVGSGNCVAGRGGDACEGGINVFLLAHGSCRGGDGDLLA